MAQWISTFPGYNWLLTKVKKSFGAVVREGPIPRHVGIIMDGNRRYARTHNIELKEGHSLGFESMASVLELLYECGVEHATVYAFSIENFKRSSYEVKWLMDLAKSKFKQVTQHGELCEEYGVRIRILGNTALLPPDVRKVLNETEQITKNNKRATLNVCFPYTSRDEITHSIKCIVNESIKQNDFIIDQSTIDKFLYTRDSPPLDLMIRTSGTYRLSDFLLWQVVSSDCAVVMVETLWPEFTPYHMAKILLNWGFNKYWYGSPQGYRARGQPLPRQYFENEDEDEGEDEDIEDQESSDRDLDSLINDEDDTMTSQDSSDKEQK
ncbi:cis-prenyltransferase [Yamadazyma tenuis]|uniref:Alkyl transferase n=1 Tax=Candida tenuis (strain ATCC 10573 / BCRC 21748 / CBS 615 / JCM 9827 / NBRC 10315 / NRRL Y-1498 / VKM Y-70) TaxID=590646 RepID=G3B4M7_CANTC|nr:Di-trans-poly-cis-decaprenylcistransferase [Yamadazyma tenuis ATCC 10573]EGV63983.1 Di-trans-poly-cis-decaprenylcistransferase [Yamadazyma tenuis ATCC 10573]WEJ96395.1 cis-prenyltransferase [Yamadazyma tenuis]